MLRVSSIGKEKLKARLQNSFATVETGTWRALSVAYQVASEKGYAHSFRNRICYRHMMQ